VLNTFADKKRKQLLLSHYFEKLKLHCINSQVQKKYYFNKLKRKAMDGFKIYFRTAVEREEKVIEFMEKREVKKYFRKIQLFNEREREKVHKHRLGSMFRSFTGSIISTYCAKIDLADHFLNTNLQYKALFSLQKARLFSQQEQYIIAFVNAALPLRRWHKMFTVRKFIRERQWFMKKNIFREWRVRLIRKESTRKAVREFKEEDSERKGDPNSESRLEVFEFENIMSTIAKIRNNLASERQESSKARKAVEHSQISGRSASESIDFEFSLESA
jgi:hypothetical protein